MRDELIDTPNPRLVPLVGRACLATIFLVSGYGKLAAPGATIAYIGSAGLPFPTAGLVVAIAVELIGGALLLLGCRTRAAAWVLAAFTLAAAIAFHSAFTDQNQFVHFLKNIAIIGGLLQVAAFGPGMLALDKRG